MKLKGIAIPGFRLKDGKPVRNKKRLSVSAQRAAGSKVKIKRGKR